MTPDEYCQQKAAPPGSSLYYALLFLPPERRRAVTALHALRREVAGVNLERLDEQVARTKLAWWRTEIAGLYGGTPRHPVTIALRPFVETFQLTAGPLNGIVAAIEMDLMQTRYLDFADLARYCERAAGELGLLCAAIYGYRNPRTLEYTRKLGVALQLTSVIRDVGEDARKNRIYLPMDELKKFGVATSDILQAKASGNFRNLMAFQARRAESFYDAALQALPPEDRRAQRAGLIMAAVYRATLAEVEHDGFRVLTQRTSLTPMRKFWLAWKTWVSN
jgi:phytoene synthase